MPHIALTRDAYGDARPEPVGAPIEVSESEAAEVASWRRVDGPALGREVDTGITTLMTVKADTDGYAAAKLVHVDRNAVHLRVYSDRWTIPPDDIDPWSLRLDRMDEPVPGVGHIPLSHAAFAGWQPAFDRLVVIGPSELGGYRTWLESGGGVFG